MAQPQPANLDLGSLKDRPTVTIDGKKYEMRTSNEFAYLVYRSHQRRFERLGTLMRKRRPTKKEEQEQARLLDDFARHLVIAPDAVHEKLRDSHRMDIVLFFSKLLPKRTETRPATAATTNGHRHHRM
jgi:hypothetical protein